MEMSCENRINFNCNNMRSKDELMDLITKVSFAMDDTRLFLDTHPDCHEAMEYFNKMKLLRYALIKEYTERFGSLVAYYPSECDPWDWNAKPLPWLSKKKGGC